MLELSKKFCTRRDALWKSQQNRAAEKRSKKNPNRILRHGYTLPFDKKQFTAWLVDIFSDGSRPIRCRYCQQPIDVYNCQIDHAVPINRSGGPGLGNLNPVCEGCNKIKHVMLPEEFELFLVKMREMADHFHNGVAVKSITHRLESYSGLKAASNQQRAKKNAAHQTVPVGMTDDDDSDF